MLPKCSVSRLSVRVSRAEVVGLHDDARVQPRLDIDYHQLVDGVGHVGDVAGEHSVIFFGKDERIELNHKANDRVIFARGALKAAQFIVGKLGQQGLNGYFTMDDVLG